MSTNLESNIISILSGKGPMLGKELMDEINSRDYFEVWKTCFNSGFLQISHFARYYLRYDISRSDYIRLSPSILRDFLSFTILALPHQRNEIIDRQIILSNYHREVSIDKMSMAIDCIYELSEKFRDYMNENYCAFIAGDIAYFLAHEEPRESINLGKFVRGSDIDVVMVFRDAVDESLRKEIEEEFLSIKYMLLRKSNYQEEIDFIFKPVSRMVEQMDCADVHQKIACKILYESIFLSGSSRLYRELKAQLVSTGAKDTIRKDFDLALQNRQESTKTLLEASSNEIDENLQSLFYFSQERVEFT